MITCVEFLGLAGVMNYLVKLTANNFESTNINVVVTLRYTKNKKSRVIVKERSSF